MTFRELALREEAAIAVPFHHDEDDRNFIQNILFNQSPVMKLWFAIMLVNLGLFLLLH
jgi:hypothetical protein